MLTPPLADAVPLHHGDKVWTQARTIGIERHYGIWDAECAMVLHNTHPGGVQYASLEAFNNKGTFVEKRATPGWEHVIVARARELIGTPYNLLSFNCEHYANVVHDGTRESPQLQRVTLGAVAVGIFGLLLSRSNGPVYNKHSGRYHDRRTGQFVAR